jgi:hypothetical protein
MAVIIELKREQLTKEHVLQIVGYLDEFWRLCFRSFPHVFYELYLVGQRFSDEMYLLSDEMPKLNILKYEYLASGIKFKPVPKKLKREQCLISMKMLDNEPNVAFIESLNNIEQKDGIYTSWGESSPKVTNGFGQPLPKDLILDDSFMAEISKKWPAIHSTITNQKNKQ